jgi:hypothetical protein
MSPRKKNTIKNFFISCSVSFKFIVIVQQCNSAIFPKYSPLIKGAEGVVFGLLLSFLLLKAGAVPNF